MTAVQSAPALQKQAALADDRQDRRFRAGGGPADDSGAGLRPDAVRAVQAGLPGGEQRDQPVQPGHRHQHFLLSAAPAGPAPADRVQRGAGDGGDGQRGAAGVVPVPAHPGAAVRRGRTGGVRPGDRAGDLPAVGGARAGIRGHGGAGYPLFHPVHRFHPGVSHGVSDGGGGILALGEGAAVGRHRAGGGAGGHPALVPAPAIRPVLAGVRRGRSSASRSYMRCPTGRMRC